MGFEGIIRPNPLQSGNPLNPYAADQALKTANAKKPEVKKPHSDENTTGVYQELPHYNEKEERKHQDHLSPEEYEEVMLFARMRGILNLALSESELYQFHINPDTGLVELIAEGTGQIVMTLTPDDLMSLTEKIHRYAGMLADRNG